MKKAKESAHVRRTRKKLERRMAEIDAKITPSALNEVSENIHKWISRHDAERIKLKGTFKLFDSNEHPAQSKSHYVNELLGQLKHEFKDEREPGELLGRIRRVGEEREEDS